MVFLQSNKQNGIGVVRRLSEDQNRWLMAAFIPPLIFALPAEIIDVKSIGLSFGVLNACLSIGIFAGPLIIGFIVDLIYDKMLVFFTMAIFTIISLLLSLILKAR